MIGRHGQFETFHSAWSKNKPGRLKYASVGSHPSWHSRTELTWKTTRWGDHFRLTNLSDSSCRKSLPLKSISLCTHVLAQAQPDSRLNTSLDPVAKAHLLFSLASNISTLPGVACPFVE